MSWKVLIFRNGVKPIDKREGKPSEMAELFDEWAPTIFEGDKMSLWNADRELRSHTPS